MDVVQATFVVAKALKTLTALNMTLRIAFGEKDKDELMFVSMQTSIDQLYPLLGEFVDDLSEDELRQLDELMEADTRKDKMLASMQAEKDGFDLDGELPDHIREALERVLKRKGGDDTDS